MNSKTTRLTLRVKILLAAMLLTVFVSDKGKAQSYCNPVFASTACSFQPYIDFSLSSASFSGTTFCSGVPCPTNYGDYYALYTANLTEGNAYALTVNYNASSSLSPFSIYCGAWIDWNNDFTFDNVTERIMTTNVGPAGAISQTGAPFTAAVAGTFRMRIILQTGSDPVPCSTDIGQNGEGKDFKVVVDPSVGILLQENAAKLTFYPNPSDLNGIFIKGLSTKNKQVHLKISDMYGNTIEQKIISADASGKELFLKLDHITAGLYLIDLMDGNTVYTQKIVFTR